MIREDYQPPTAPVCRCIPGPDGQTDSDDCVLHDLPLSGHLLIGEDDQ